MKPINSPDAPNSIIVMKPHVYEESYLKSVLSAVGPRCVKSQDLKIGDFEVCCNEY